MYLAKNQKTRKPDGPPPCPRRAIANLQSMSRPNKFVKFDPQTRAEIQNTICVRIAEGETLSAILREPFMPRYETVARWLRDDGNFLVAYRQARELQSHRLVDEAVDEARSASSSANPNKIKGAQLLISTLQWTASRLNPGEYSEKFADGRSGITVVINTPLDLGRSDRVSQAGKTTYAIIGGKALTGDREIEAELGAEPEYVEARDADQA